MKLNSKMTTWGLLATLAAASVSPALAGGRNDRSSTQDQKNTMRNLGIAGAAVAAVGLLNHNNTLALLGGAGAALAGSQYEKDRRQQSQDNHYYYRDGRNGYDNRTWNSVNRYDRNGNDGAHDQSHDWSSDNGRNSQRWNQADRSRDTDRRWNQDTRSGDRDGDYEHSGDRR